MEGDAFAKLDLVDLAVFADLRHLGRQQRRHVPVLVEGEQRLEDVLADHADEICGSRHRVERRRLADGRDVDHAALVRFGRRIGRQRRECGGDLQ
jgi:hypothetical protein